MHKSILCGLLASLVAGELPAQDTVRVRADGPPAWGPNVRLVEELAIGQVDGPPQYAFGQIVYAAVEKGGGFYLFDGNDGQIRRYDNRGCFTNLMGRKGAVRVSTRPSAGCRTRFESW
jgi:hypothetical protein